MLTEEGAGSVATTMDLSLELGRLLAKSQMTIGTAESCTGGLVASAITDVAGSSAWFDRGVVTYSNAAKQMLLGVNPVVFEQHGAVSEACVVAMAAGAVQNFGVDVAISVSGIAGPGGASPGKPVGTVWIGWAHRYGVNPCSDDSGTRITSDVAAEASVFHFSGGRCEVRVQAVHQALRGTISLINNIGTSRE